MIEPNTIHCGDCLELMPQIQDQSVDMVLCDLPYGTTACKWDVIIPFDQLWEQYKRICKPNATIVLFCQGYFTIDLILSNKSDFRYKLIWKKNVPTGMSSAKYRPMKYYEEICVFGNTKSTYNPQMKDRVGKGKDCYRYDHYCGNSNHIQFGKVKKKYDPLKVQPSDVLEFNVVPNRKGKLHPTEKPVDLLQYLIRTYTNKNDVVLDNTMGSGSTIVAAIKEKRQYIGIEKEEKYFDIANRRIAAETSQLSLF